MYLKQASWGISQFFWLPQEYSDKMAAVLLGVNTLHQPPCVCFCKIHETRPISCCHIRKKRDNCFKLI